ncbi:MAG TPA: sugar phosphate isomerase/epimerase [Terriglobales bacterium]|nr:sugar phosphate isomerase/epimerase [Terriglobales bacterium]
MSDFARRQFLKIGGASAAALGAAGALPAAAPRPTEAAAMPAATPYPKLSIVTRYAPAKLQFAARVGYEGVVIASDDFFDPDKLSDSQIEGMLATAREAGIRIISIECMWGYNHIDPDPGRRAAAQAKFIRALELGHRLGCKFVGTFSGGMPGATIERQAAELAAAFNEKYLPVCERLDMTMGWENYPTATNFATSPGAMKVVFAQTPSPRLGLEFDPSHLVRLYVDPVRAAWELRDHILAVHAKDTEITKPVLQEVGIHGQGWWRYRIPGQGLVDWPALLTVLLQVKFAGGIAVEHEDAFWGGEDTGEAFSAERQDGFLLAHRFLSMYLPGRLA